MSRSHFKLLAIFSLFLLVPAGFATFLSEDQLPTVLAAYVESELEKEFTIVEVVISLVALAAIAANIGFLFFARWARPTFALSVFATTAGMAFFGPVVQTAFETAIYEVSLVVDGILIALVYFSDLKHEFVKITHNE